MNVKIDHADPFKRPLMETTADGTPVRYYIWGAGRLLAVIDADGTTRYAHCDDFGSVVGLSNTNGATMFTASYGPYGEPWGTTGTNATPFGWLGGHGVFQVANSSLYLTRHRAYDTTLKRFLSADPLGLGGGANLYAYGNGNPLAYIDPLGLCAENSSGFWPLFGNALNNTATAMNQSMGQTIYSAVAGEWDENRWNQIANGLWSTATPDDPRGTPYISTALGVSGAAATVAAVARTKNAKFGEYGVHRW